MCGIIGYAGHRPAVPLIVEGLRRLEYRGYDSAGVATVQNKEIELVRAEGKLAALDEKLAQKNVTNSTFGVGHTRWATHGVPVERNAHPHLDHEKKIAMIHNGIIENYQEIKTELLAKGYEFRSDTDSEVLCNLIAEGRKHNSSMLESISWALKQVEGAYAIAVVSIDEPGTVYAARVASPMVMGVGVGENFVASDIPAFLPYTRDVVFIEDGELVKITSSSWDVFNAETLEPVEKEIKTINWDVQAAQKGGYKHFMIKEIFEQPKVISDCLAGRVDQAKNEIILPEVEGMEPPERLHIIACGTSYHAGLWGKYLIEQWAKIPVEVEIASEFRYRDPLLSKGGVALAISQSGETADTLAGIKLAKEKGLSIIGLCNVVGSSVARESDYVMYTQAGPEISVASTKAMCSQLTALLLLALYWGKKKGVIDAATYSRAAADMRSIPSILETALPAMRSRAQELSREYSEANSFFFLGRGLYFPLALEGALKLKEISYIHAEGYASGEMKHGPIALIDPKFPTFAMALNDDLFPKVKSNLVEVQARGGEIIALTNPGVDLDVEHRWSLPEVWGPLNTFIALPALQLFAYETADYLGKDVDQPRNLAKSVTVE
ncbi:glutamine--fructose-6-phosphate transaminase (isomerizing) [Maridesulfovibrio salexigens]|uniref:Glutamine--fructose-6-phosphate aminotransferase [isomerizing] n=1 Tax=Maridesulfovibrio salexigens (strain ATCC 14822 / DSM 2638 / NCIMB 8403 / VKM B-1763) TaxID=526222 RepID=C6BTD1_MARSD|nr:glutamine--fructose-6-phosphate transaminase (isomerizing) [Maridesulfovibrio salexigens]ACS81612.1 glucosamine/fructose-6-phosphate aminotransferase, isomerizing [Maridesulfovibrio salexigens DSM 2638]